MRLNINNITFVYILLILSIVGNFFMFPQLALVHLFAIIYLTISYKYFSDTAKDMVYYSTILFALINFSLKIPLGSRYDIYYFYITLFIYIVIFVINTIKTNNLHIKSVIKNKYSLFLVVFFVYMILSVLLATDKKMAIKYIFNFCIMISLLLMFVFENINQHVIKKTLNFLQYVYVGIISLGLLEIFGIRYGTRNHFAEWDAIAFQIHYVKRIPVVFFYNPNNYAIFLVIGMILTGMQIIFSKNKKKRYIYISIYVLSQINLIFTRSRTAWLTIFIAFMFCAAFYYIKGKEDSKRIGKSVLKLACFTLIIFLAISFIPGMQPYYGKITGSKLLSKLNISGFEYKSPDDEKLLALGKKGSSNQRFTLLYDVIHGVIVKKNYLGFGAGNIENYVESMANTYGVLNIHSLWFEILGNFGIAIFLYTIYIYLSMIYNCLKNYKFANEEMKKYLIMISTATFAFIFLAFAPSTMMWYPAFWMTLGMTIALIKYNKLLKN
ncbi:teichuronic acid biosynthesis protein TuaE [Clostridium acetireducens DSM 10703]|uniref:Teichuronic acid biosynthesis protein TuaE n=1 Tax=Clostridium acetireducens DSM 10703 TaxID=1121290 RepID=A0A1E8EXX3_9CLOT|nr:O-antigen ligase family protein [Clostridium acetireducens]OFI05788.1 teichuronic acid biosynthesis protein TuaE [Clostridium acetireducens DSM 10703]